MIIILLLDEHGPTLQIARLKERTNLDDQQLVFHTIPLLRNKILLREKQPSDKLTDSENLTLNYAYEVKKREISTLRLQEVYIYIKISKYMLMDNTDRTSKETRRGCVEAALDCH
jgi:hypothetical protein